MLCKFIQPLNLSTYQLNNESTDQPINQSTDQPINLHHLINYTLHLADSALILGHRNSEWTGHGPILEQDIAISNIALDLIGQSRYFYQYAAEVINQHNITYKHVSERAITEDDLAYLRDVREYKNCLLVEQPNSDWAQTILRQFFFSAFQFLYYEQLKQSNNQQLAAIAEKALKETTYHLRWSSEWVIRLGDGTDESHARMQKAINELWMFTGELFTNTAHEDFAFANGFGVDARLLSAAWNQKVSAVFAEATLEVPQTNAFQTGGKTGLHTEHLGYLLADMQFLQRAYPNATW